MRHPQNSRVNSQPDALPSDQSEGKSDGNSNTRDLLRWLIIIPVIWILIFGCGALSIVGAAPPTPLDLLSNNQADYSPWQYFSLQPFREGFLEDIKNDFALLDDAVSVFTPPKEVSDPFIKPTESSIEISIQVTATKLPSSTADVIATATDVFGTDLTESPTPFSTEDMDATPTVSLTPSTTGTPGPSPTHTQSLTPSPTPTSSSTPTPTATITKTPSLTPTPSNTSPPLPTTPPTESINICGSYDYFHTHNLTWSSTENAYGIVLHAIPLSGPETQVVLTGVTVNQDPDNPTILTVTKLLWYHPGFGTTTINVGQQSESVHVSTNLPFFACYAAGQCDTSLYGGIIEAVFDGPPDGGYSLEVTVNFPAFGQTCRATK
jgi:hypothetical protein